MKINNECARKVLIEVENISYGETLSVAKLQERLSEYSIETVLDIVTIFNRERYLNIVDKLSYDNTDVLRDHKIKCLTEKGYKTLDLIRNDDVWNLLKEKLKNFENISIFSLFDMANKIINVQNNKLFNLPEDMFLDNIRW